MSKDPNVHFDFTLSAADAENLFDCITTKISVTHEMLLSAILEKDVSAQAAYRRDIEYFQELKKKLTNKQDSSN